MEYVLGIDLGTSSLKALLVGSDGSVLTEASAEYPLLTPQTGYSEQEPRHWIEAAEKVIGEVIKAIPDAKTNTVGISISGQMHSLVVLDKADHVLRNAILWNDVRTTKQCEEITEKLGDRLIAITKNRALEGFTLPKILWVKENEPEIYGKIKTFLLPKDYLGFWLTGNKQMDYSDAAGTLLLNIEEREWSEEILGAFGLPSSICPPLKSSSQSVGSIKKELLDKFGFTREVQLYPGGADNACAATGAGILDSTTAMCSIGTSGVFLSFEPDKKVTYNGQLHFFNHAVPDACYSMGVTLAAGGSLNWFRDTFAAGESFEALLKNISSIPIGSGGLLFSPYIMGERTPYADSRIRGSFIGADITHTRDNFARAVLEGITFSLKDSQVIMTQVAGKTFSRIISVGGGSKNPDWLQMQADIFDCTVITLANEQGPAFGAAMIAAVGTGWFNSFQSCAESFVKYKDSYQPIKENAEKYKKVYALYQQIYNSTKDICHGL